MIVDLTEAFYTEAATSRTAHTQSNWHSSLFIKTSTSYLADLTSLDSKLNDLEKCIHRVTQASAQGLASKSRRSLSASSTSRNTSSCASRTSSV
jgi:spore maturation protein CgeB